MVRNNGETKLINNNNKKLKKQSKVTNGSCTEHRSPSSSVQFVLCPMVLRTWAELLGVSRDPVELELHPECLEDSLDLASEGWAVGRTPAVGAK